MSKKIKSAIIFLIVLSPAITALLAGYPLRKIPHPDGSRRCFKVGELGQFIACYGKSTALSGKQLLEQLGQEASSFSPYFGFILTALLTASSVAAALVVFEDKTVKKRSQ